jgi:hypothetical protein
LIKAFGLESGIDKFEVGRVCADWDAEVARIATGPGRAALDELL